MAPRKPIVGYTTPQSPLVDNQGRITWTWTKWFQGIQQALSQIPLDSGSVSSVSVAAANGFDGSVTNPTTTPNIQIRVDDSHYLPTTTDEANWNAKQPAGSYIARLTGDVTAVGPGDAAATVVKVNGAAVPTSQAYVGTNGAGQIVAASAPTSGINQLTGDVTAGPGSGSQAATLAASGVTAGSYTNANVTVDAKGRVTAAANGSGGSGITALTGDVAATGPGSAAATIQANAVTTSKINNSAVTLAKIANAAASSKLLGSGASGSGAAYTELTLGTNLSMSGTTLNAAGSGTVTTTGSPASGNLTKFSGASSITNGDLSGDVSTSGSLVATLANTPVTPGSYINASVTVDSKGRLTSVANGAGGSGTGMFAGIISVPTKTGTGLSTAFNTRASFSATDTADGIYITDSVGIVTENVEGITMAYPGAAFTVSSLFTIPPSGSTAPGVGNFNFLGYLVATSTSGKLMLFGMRYNSGVWQVTVANYTNYTTFSAFAFTNTTPTFSTPFIWLRYKDDGTNISFTISYDGIHWPGACYTVSKASSFLGSSGFNLFGLGIDPTNGLVGTVVSSYTLTTP